MDSLPPANANEYDVLLPFKKEGGWGVILTTKEFRGYHEGQMYRPFRNIGDKIVLIDGKSTAGKSYQQIKRMISASEELGRTGKNSHFRMLDCIASSMAHNDDDGQPLSAFDQKLKKLQQEIDQLRANQQSHLDQAANHTDKIREHKKKKEKHEHFAQTIGDKITAKEMELVKLKQAEAEKLDKRARELRTVIVLDDDDDDAEDGDSKDEEEEGGKDEEDDFPTRRNRNNDESDENGQEVARTASAEKSRGHYFWVTRRQIPKLSTTASRGRSHYRPVRRPRPVPYKPQRKLPFFSSPESRKRASAESRPATIVGGALSTLSAPTDTGRPVCRPDGLTDGRRTMRDQDGDEETSNDCVRPSKVRRTIRPSKVRRKNSDFVVRVPIRKYSKYD